MLFAALLLVAAAPVMLLALWVERAAVDREVASVQEKHLLVARNLGSTLQRCNAWLATHFRADYCTSLAQKWPLLT